MRRPGLKTLKEIKSMKKVGDRVAALLSANQQEVKLLGFGVYEGNFVPEADAPGWMAEMLHKDGTTNPRIRLDDGRIVYGCQCWWGLEDEVKKSFGDRTVISVGLDGQPLDPPHDQEKR
jgi:hypothetical protein